MRLIYFILILILVSGGCSNSDNFRKNAKLKDGKWIACISIKKGMYQCRVYSLIFRKLIEERNFLSPFYYSGINELDLSDKILKYDRDAVYIEGNKKLFYSDVPEDAECIQGLKYGVWVYCKSIDKKTGKYFCTVYNVKDGKVLSNGKYLVKRFEWDKHAVKMKYYPVKNVINIIQPVYYGGVGITLKNKLILMPDGWIDYPQGARSGLRVLYNTQGKITKEVEY